MLYFLSFIVLTNTPSQSNPLALQIRILLKGTLLSDFHLVFNAISPLPLSLTHPPTNIALTLSFWNLYYFFWISRTDLLIIIRPRRCATPGLSFSVSDPSQIHLPGLQFCDGRLEYCVQTPVRKFRQSHIINNIAKMEVTFAAPCTGEKWIIWKERAVFLEIDISYTMAYHILLHLSVLASYWLLKSVPANQVGCA